MTPSTKTRQFRFLIGFEEVKKECSFNECRFFAFKVAAQRNENVRVICYNYALNEWDELGTALPNGLYIDFFGCACAINKEGDGLDHFGKLDACYSDDEVAKFSHSRGPHITKATQSEIEFDNGVLFVQHPFKSGYHICRGINESYPKGLAEYTPNY